MYISIWEFELPFPGSLTSRFLQVREQRVRDGLQSRVQPDLVRQKNRDFVIDNLNFFIEKIWWPRAKGVRTSFPRLPYIHLAVGAQATAP